jgi:hypothetical protein
MANQKEKDGTAKVALLKGDERKHDIVKLSHLSYWVEQWIDKGYDVEIIDIIISKKNGKK